MRQRGRVQAALQASLDLTALERRVLQLLDQQGPMHRRQIVAALKTSASEGDEERHDTASAMIMGNWCRRLMKAGLVSQARQPDGQYSHHEITAAGQLALRRAAEG